MAQSRVYFSLSFLRIPFRLVLFYIKVIKMAQFSCPECPQTGDLSVITLHFNAEHQPKETSMQRNHYISFPHEQLPRYIPFINVNVIPEYRLNHLEMQLVQLYQANRVTPALFSQQMTAFAGMKARIEGKYPGICCFSPVWTVTPLINLSDSPFDINILLSKTYLNQDKIEAYRRIFTEDWVRVAQIGGSFLHKILPDIKETDPNTVTYHVKSKQFLERVPENSKEPKFTFITKHIGLYFKVNSLFFDLAAYNHSAMQISGLVSAYSAISAKIPILCVALKYWAQKRRIIGKQLNLPGSFAIFVLLIHFLQNYPNERKGICPQLQQNLQPRQHFRAATEGEIATFRGNSTSIGGLFVEFFRYYADFNWKNMGISMRQAGIVMKRPATIEIYIENPLPPYDNLADQYNDKSAVLRVMNEFRRAFFLVNRETNGLKRPKEFEGSLLWLVLDPSSY